MKKILIVVTIISTLSMTAKPTLDAQPPGFTISRQSPVQVIDMGGAGYDASSRSVSLVATVAFAAIMTGIILAIGFSNSAHVSHNE